MSVSPACVRCGGGLRPGDVTHFGSVCPWCRSQGRVARRDGEPMTPDQLQQGVADQELVECVLCHTPDVLPRAAVAAWNELHRLASDQPAE